jgi:spoIIIJ-associated protein
MLGVEEGISKGLKDLGLPEEAVEIEVLDLGSKGLFGLGTRQARVRLTIKDNADEIIAETLEVANEVETVDETPDDLESDVKTHSKDEEGSSDLQKAEINKTETNAQSSEETGEFESGTEEDITENYKQTKDEIAVYIARTTVEELLEKMRISATIEASWSELDEEHNRPTLLVEITGKDLSVLIGPRAETLNALQYITNLIVGKELGHSVPLIVDVEGYRERRKEQIRRLANKMAEQAITTGRRQVLEPMPASERRLVHIELRIIRMSKRRVLARNQEGR